MTFDPQKLLDAHNGDALAALNALESQRHEAQEGRDREGRAAQAARRERDAARSELDTANEALRAAQQNAAPEGAVILTGDDAQFWMQQQAQGGREHLQARLTRADDADTLERTVTAGRAAALHSVSEGDLSEWLAGRALSSESRKDAEGNDATVYGVTVQEDGKDVFRPLTEFKTFTALTAQAGTQQQERPRIPAQTTNGKEPEKGGIAQRQNQQAAPHLRPKTT